MLDSVQRDPAASPASRAVAAALVAQGGIVARSDVATALDALGPVARKAFRAAGVTIGALDLFDARLLKAGPAWWRRALLAARQGVAGAAGPRDGASVLARGEPGATLDHGFRPVAAQAVRIDLIERIAGVAHDARGTAGRKPFALDPALARSMGLTRPTLDRLMAGLGFRPAPAGSQPEGDGRHWIWRGRPPVKAVPPPADTALAGAFAALATSALHG